MDADKIVHLLRATLQPDQQKNAEAELTKIHKTIGFGPLLLQLVMSEQLDKPVRQAGVIYLKNAMMQFWEDSTDESCFHILEQDRAAIRDNIIEAVVASVDPIRVQLGVCVGIIVKYDFPGRWPGILEKVTIIIQSDQPDTWLGALICLYKLVKHFEFKKSDERAALHQGMAHLLPILHQRCQQLMPDMSVPAVTVQKQILKIYFGLIQFFLPMDLVTRPVFTQWMELVRQILARPIPAEAAQVEEDERVELIWWKVKKWAMHILLRCFERYGSPGNTMKQYKQFADWYLKSFTVGIMEVLMQQLELKKCGGYVSPRVLQEILNYLEHGVAHSLSWKLMKPHMQVITEHVLFPLFCHSDEDEELWEADPVEYVRSKYDVYEEFLSPVTAAQALLHAACAKRKECLQKSMGFVMQLLTGAPTNGAVNVRHKDGALHMVGALADIFLGKKMYREQAEPMLVSHVYTEFSSTHGFLRSRACWVMQKFCEMTFSNEVNMVNGINSIREAMCTDKDIPVRVEAAMALHSMLACQDNAKDILQPHVRTIVLELLKIIRETENEDLTTLMQKIVCTYIDDIVPLAVEITNHLCETFVGLVNSDEEITDNKSVATMGILNTLDTIVTVMEEQKEILTHIEGIVLKVVGIIIQKELIDFYDLMFELVTSLTCKVISPTMWSLLPLLGQMFQKDCFDYFTDMMPALHNYVTVDPATFMSDTQYLELLFSMCKSVLTGDSGDDAECHAAKLLECILLQYRGQVDAFMMPFVHLCLERLTREVHTSELRTILLQVVIAALYCNPSFLIESLMKMQLPNSSESIMGQFLQQWLHDTDCFLGLHDRKLCVLGLCAIMDSSSDRPKPITDAASNIMPAVIMLFAGLKRAYVSRAEEENEEEEEDDDETFDGEEVESDEDVIDEQNVEYFEKLESAEGDTDDENDECDDDICEETALEVYQTPIDDEDSDIDEYQIFTNLLRLLETRDNSWYQTLMQPLSVEQRNELQEVFLLAEQRRAAAESRKIEKGGGYNFTQIQVPQEFNFSSP